MTHTKSLAAVATATALCSLLLTGCGGMSETSKASSKTAICSTADAQIASLAAGGDGAQAVASLINDTTDDPKVGKAARAVANGDGDEKARATLEKWIKRTC